MNGARTTFMRRGYLLTALAAAVLLAASPGIASAQSIGFVGSSGTVSETASMEAGAIEGPHSITIRATGFPPVGSPRRVITGVSVNPSAAVAISATTATGAPLTVGGTAVAHDNSASALDLSTAFQERDEVVLKVAQYNATSGAQAGDADNNWLDEKITLTLTTGTAAISISPNVYTLTVDDQDVAPVAKFTTDSFTLTEGSDRMVSLDIVEGMRGAGIPGALDAGETGTITVRVSNHRMVTIGDGASVCPGTTAATALLGQTTKAFHIALGTGWSAPADADAVRSFGRTARLATDGTAGTITALVTGTAAASMTIRACNVSGFRNQQVTLTIDGTPGPTALVESPGKGASARGDIMIGSPLTVTVDSDEAAPTLSFSPTDVTIDEGDSTSTRLIADGASATEVGMVKLMVEGHAMVDLYHEDTLLEEMDGYVTVDLGMGNSARLTAMSMSDPDLMDGETKYKAWKLMEGSSDAAIGDDYWFRVDVMGSTAVPALPLVGQLLLALFLMAGGSRLYRRRNG